MIDLGVIGQSSYSIEYDFGVCSLSTGRERRKIQSLQDMFCSMEPQIVWYLNPT